LLRQIEYSTGYYYSVADKFLQLQPRRAGQGISLLRHCVCPC